LAANAIDATNAANLMMALGIYACEKVKTAPPLVGSIIICQELIARPTPQGEKCARAISLLRDEDQSPQSMIDPRPNPRPRSRSQI
jgi:hypothetical protein